MRQLTQTVERQNKVIEQATARGELSRMAWFVEVHAADKRFRGVDGKRYFCYEFPPRSIPIVPITGNGVMDRIAIELFTMLVEEANQGKRLEFYPALSWLHEMQDEPFYRLENLALDLVCPTCGAVRAAPTAHDETGPVVCPGCMADVR